MNQRARRQHRVRIRAKGTESRPRLSVFRSSRHFGAQLIDDTHGKTLVSASDLELSSKKSPKKKTKVMNRMERARWVGEHLAEKAKEKKILAVQFDRGWYRYHGLVKALADGARKGGLKF